MTDPRWGWCRMCQGEGWVIFAGNEIRGCPRCAGGRREPLPSAQPYVEDPLAPKPETPVESL